MKFFFAVIFTGSVLACRTGNPDTTGKQLTGVKIFKNNQLCSHSGGSADCSSKLVSTQSGPDTTCPDNDDSLHWWPIDSSSDCHGWQATDPFGKLHDNSANNIRCSLDGLTLLYDQWAGTLGCNAGSPVSKSFVLNECHQGRPPILWDKGRDFSCCGQEVVLDDTTPPPTDTGSTSGDGSTSGGQGGVCCSDGTAPISDGDHTTPPCLDGLAPSASNCNQGGFSSDSARPGAGSTVTVTTYMDAECKTTPSWKNSTFTMDANAACNVLPDSSTSDLRCYDTYITYMNYPNTNDCSFANPLFNRLEVGVCQEFPGPVRTWKKVDGTYNCRTEGAADSSAAAPEFGGEINDIEDSSKTKSSESKSKSSKSKSSKYSKQGQKNSKKGKTNNFRVAGTDGNQCARSLFTIQSAKNPGHCLDATNKRLVLSKCDDANAGQHFTMDAVGALMQVEGHSGCIAQTSPTTGPCEGGIEVARMGPKHTFKLGGKCLNARSKSRVNLVKCHAKRSKQHWFVVPTFKPAAPAAVGSGNFRVNSKDTNDKKKGEIKGDKKGEGEIVDDKKGQGEIEDDKMAGGKSGGETEDSSGDCPNEKPKDNAFSVEIGFWRNEAGGSLGDECFSCNGDPMIQTFYPVADADDKCWQWPGGSGKNSMRTGTCNKDDGSFTFTQWAATCSCAGEPGAVKTVYTSKCVVDIPNTICAKVLDYTACQ